MHQILQSLSSDVVAAVYGVTPAPEYSACILVITEREGEGERI